MKKGFCRGGFKEAVNFLKSAKWYVVAIFGIFCLSFLIGFAFPVFFRQEIITFIREISMQFEGLGVGETIGKIFLNNLRASFLSTLFGIALGIFPVMSAVFNGYVVGFVSHEAVYSEGIFVLWRLLPHGIFEIPAVIISMALGLKLGLGFFRKEKFADNFCGAMKVFLFIVLPLLILAAVIEGFLIVFVS